MSIEPSKALNGRLKRFLICGDNHGMYADKGALEAVLSFKEFWKPNIIIHLGDLWDFPNLRKGASNEDIAEAIERDFDEGKFFATELFKGKAEKYFLFGNHDYRMIQLVESVDGRLSHYGDFLVDDSSRMFKKLGVTTFPYDARKGILKLGHLCVIHGFHHGMSACAQHARIYGNVVFGHIHSIESYAVPGLEEKEARAIGCLCDLNLEYMRPKTAKLRWQHGFAYGIISPEGYYQIFQAREIAGKYVVASDTKII